MTPRNALADHAASELLASQISNALADPDEVARRRRPPPWWRQSLASGALAIALLHVHRARCGDGPWNRAHEWLRLATSGLIDEGPGSNLHYGAPALGYVLHHAAGTTGRYQRALRVLDERVATITRRRLDAAHRRLDTGRLPALAEFDAIRGLTGLGAYWLHRARARGEAGPLLPEVITYLVRLTEPLHHTGLGMAVPGWWTTLAPTGRISDTFRAGHANHGVAHGIAGPFALLALAGAGVDGCRDAVTRIQLWLDRWRVTDGRRSWWPYWITAADLPVGPPARTPGRPSWCYGTPGIARAQQLAALALDQPERRRAAESALVAVLDDPAQIAGLADASLCHGHAGLLDIARRAAADAQDDGLSCHLPELRARVTSTSADRLRPRGLLEGAAGVALALTDDMTGWATCLLTG